MTIAHLEVLSWMPGQRYERWERPAPGVAEGGVLLEDEDEEDGEEDVDICEGRGAGSESDSELGEEAIVRFFLVPFEVGVSVLVQVHSLSVNLIANTFITLHSKRFLVLLQLPTQMTFLYDVVDSIDFPPIIAGQ